VNLNNLKAPVLNVLNSPQHGDEWSDSRPGRFTPEHELLHASNRRLGRPQRRNGRFGEDNHLCPWGGGFQTPLYRLLSRRFIRDAPRARSKYKNNAVPLSALICVSTQRCFTGRQLLMPSDNGLRTVGSNQAAAAAAGL